MVYGWRDWAVVHFWNMQSYSLIELLFIPVPSQWAVAFV